jgi:hypothetical protein
LNTKLLHVEHIRIRDLGWKYSDPG